MKRFAWTLTLLFLACATAYVVVAPETTLAVDSRAMSPVSVYLDGRVIGKAMPGRVTCFRLSHLLRGGRNVLSYRETAGVIIMGPAEHLSHHDGWTVTLGQTFRMDVLSLQPAERCR